MSAAVADDDGSMELEDIVAHNGDHAPVWEVPDDDDAHSRNPPDTGSESMSWGFSDGRHSRSPVSQLSFGSDSEIEEIPVNLPPDDLAAGGGSDNEAGGGGAESVGGMSFSRDSPDPGVVAHAADADAASIASLDFDLPVPGGPGAGGGDPVEDDIDSVNLDVDARWNTESKKNHDRRAVMEAMGAIGTF